MKNKNKLIVVLSAILLLSCATPVRAQLFNVPALPNVDFQFNNAAGTGPAALGFLCTYFGGTTIPLSTYADPQQQATNQNPIRLNSAGRPVNGSSAVGIYVLPTQNYRYILYAAGTGNTCNGTTVGAQIWDRDQVPSIEYPLVQTYGITLINTAADIGPRSNETVLFANNSGVVEICPNGMACETLAGYASGISGTTGFLPVFTSSSTLGSSLVQEDPQTNPDHVLKVNERLLVNGTSSDVTTGALVGLGAIREVNSPFNAQSISLYALGGGSGRAFLDSSHTGSGTTKPLAFAIDGTEALQISTDPFIQITASYAGGNLSAAGTVALRNNAGALEASQNGGAWASIAAGGTVTNSGTSTKHLPKLTSATAITDSSVTEETGPFVQLNTSYTGATKSTAGTVALRNNAGALEVSENNGTWTHVASGGTVSGTTGTMAKFTGASAVGNSSVTEDTGAGVLIVAEKLRVNGTTDDYGIGALINIGGLTVMNSTSNAVVGTLSATGGGSGRLILNSTHSGSGTTKPISLQVDSNEFFKVMPSGDVCMYFVGTGLRYLTLSSSAVIIGGAC